MCRGLDGKAGKIKWWHGTGSFLDYTNPAALAWWHSQVRRQWSAIVMGPCLSRCLHACIVLIPCGAYAQMDLALTAGIDGWKCDGTDPYLIELVRARGHGGEITPR